MHSATGKVPVLAILIMTLFMSAAKGLGAVPFFFFKTLTPAWSGLANAVACGVMLTASFQLLNEGAPYGPALVLLGVVLGAIAMKASQQWLNQHEDVSFEQLKGSDARKAILIVGVMAAHAFGEGSGVGVSFSGNRGWAQGTLVTIAIGLHNIPEGLATATVMVARGASAQKALLWSVLTSTPQVLVAVPSFLFVELFSALLPLALGFAAGCMIWIVVAEMLPDALEQIDHDKAASAATVAAGCLYGLNVAISSLEDGSGTLTNPVQANLSVLLPAIAMLLPSMFVPLGAAGLLFGILASAPVSLGVSLGVTTWLGVASATQTFVTQPQGEWSSLVLWLLSGVAATLLLARVLGDPKAKSVDELPPPKLAVNLEADKRGHTRPYEQENWQAYAAVEVNDKRAGQVPKDYVELDLGFMGPPRYQDQSYVHDDENCTCKGDSCPNGAHPAKYGPTIRRSSDELDPVDTWSTSEYASRRFQLKAVTLACIALAGYSMASGLTVARGIFFNTPEALSLLVPVALWAVPQALACVGLARAAFATNLKFTLILTASVVSLVYATAAVYLLGSPVGSGNLDKVDFDIQHLGVHSTAFMSGVLLMVSLGYLWPAARQTRVERVQLGLMLGVVGSAAMWLLSAGLCWGTTYCTHVYLQ